MEGLNSPEIEGLLNKFIESPLGQNKKNLIECKNLDYTDPKLLVALRLFPLVQQLRYSKAKGFTDGSELDNLLKLMSSDEKTIFAWAHAQEAKTQVIRFRLSSNDFNFYPERGIFRVPLVPKNRDKDLPGWIQAFPIHPNVLIAYVPLNADLTLLHQLPLGSYSTAGYNGCERFIIPPLIFQNNDEKYILAEFQRLHDVSELQDELLSSLREVQLVALKLVAATLAGRLSAADIRRITNEQKLKKEALTERMKDLAERREALNPGDPRVGQAWTYWKNAI